jgi:hypothetical protein
MPKEPIALSYTELAPAQSVAGGKRRGDLLVMDGDTVLPAMCFACGTFNGVQPRAFFIAAPLSPHLESTAPVFRLHTHVCRRHHLRRVLLQTGALIAIALFPCACLFGSLLFLVFPRTPGEVLIVADMSLLLIAVILNGLAGRGPHVVNMDDEVVLVRGVHPAVLEKLPLDDSPLP